MRRHAVRSGEEIGGQLNIARKVPGKEEFNETLRYFRRQIELRPVCDVRLNTRASADADRKAVTYELIVLATGVTPRMPYPSKASIRPRCSATATCCATARPVGPRVAIIGAGGIGFDVAEYLTKRAHSPALDANASGARWGMDDTCTRRGGLMAEAAARNRRARQVFLLQRKTAQARQALGKTTGWIHRATLKMTRRRDDRRRALRAHRRRGLHVTIGTARTAPARSRPYRHLRRPGTAIATCTPPLPCPRQAPCYLIGGADEAGELDAKRAIDQGTRLAAAL
jgi:2,4-dienoyl-CoA reductase (NADPH2)